MEVPAARDQSGPTLLVFYLLVPVRTAMSESSADAQPSSTADSSASSPADSQKFWEFADLGFDTEKKLWFIQFYNAINENVGTYFARSVHIERGRAAQYQWKDSRGAPFWHVRERLYATEVERLSIDPAGGAITLIFKHEEGGETEKGVPEDFAYLLYAYHLTSNDNGRAPMGFVEFYDAEGALVGRVDNRWMIIEGVNRRTVGDYPALRIRVERPDISGMTVTQTAVVLQGRQAGAHEQP
jgi:hypothetical protein